MIITYLRSSSYGCHDMCAMKWYLEYNLGWRGPSNIKAEKGTVVHKALELLAVIKLNQQNGVDKFEDEIVGEIDIFDYDLDEIIRLCTEYYSSNSIHEWKPIDWKHCVNWTYKALEYGDGEFDPRNTHIIQPEQSFDITIEKPWAMYEYTMPDGEYIEGFFSIKGTIDQISKIDDETYQILDWKTGRRLNWATGEEKTYDKLCNDPQLMMYYYAIQHLYPEIDHIQLVIYFINDGGPYTICFSKSDLPRIEKVLEKKFHEIRDTKVPALSKSWKCSKFCHFGRTTFEGTSVLPIVEKRNGQVTKKGQYMTKCEQTKYCIEKRGMEKVMNHMTAPGHHIDYYQEPGAIGL